MTKNWKLNVGKNKVFSIPGCVLAAPQFRWRVAEICLSEAAESTGKYRWVVQWQQSLCWVLLWDYKRSDRILPQISPGSNSGTKSSEFKANCIHQTQRIRDNWKRRGAMGGGALFVKRRLEGNRVSSCSETKIQSVGENPAICEVDERPERTTRQSKRYAVPSLHETPRGDWCSIRACLSLSLPRTPLSGIQQLTCGPKGCWRVDTAFENMLEPI